MSTNDSERRTFDWLMAQALTGRHSRREIVRRAAALGLSGAALTTLGAAAAPGSGATKLLRAAQDGAPKPGGILKVGLQADPTGLDPHVQSLTAIWHIVEQVYSNLTAVNPDLSISPSLAESWDISDDGLTYTFHLRAGVAFHDGAPLKASDVKFSFERLVSEEMASPSAADLTSMASVEAPDDATVVLTLKAPDASILASLAGASTIVMSEAFVAANDDDVTQTAMGTGPFVFTEYVPNTRVVLEKNPNYWEEGLPYVDGIEMTIAPEDTSRTGAVVTGTVDFIEYAPLRDIEMFEADSSLALAGNTNTNIRMIGCNLEKEPFNNPLVRQAIAAVIDREAILGPAVFGHGLPTETIFPPDYWAALRQEVRPPDVEKARALMAEAGLADGFETTITSWSQYSFLSSAAVVVQEQIKQIGIEAELNMVENATMIDQVYVAKTYDIAVTGTSAYVDPNGVFLDFKTGESGNWVSYSNARVDELIAEGIAVTDQAQRAEIYQELQQ
ncbi:MAG: ABC transporter substrate-binding protein, partial [Thermomicrobiales bacterium]